MTTVDARGLSCPLPVMRTYDALRASSPDELRVLVDSGTARTNVAGLLSDEGYEVSVERHEDGAYTLSAKR